MPVNGKTSLIIRALVALGSVVLTAGCGGRGEKASADSVGGVAPVAPAAAMKAPPDPCVKNGLWAECTVERRLNQSGFVVTRLDTASRKRDGFTVKPVVYSLGKSRLEVFLYDSEADAQRDVANLDTIAVAPTGKTVSWPTTPIFIRNTNLLAVLLTENPRQAERASLALTAGPPQKSSSR